MTVLYQRSMGNQVWCAGTGDPNTVDTAPRGSFYLDSVNQHLWVNLDNATAWRLAGASVTTAVVDPAVTDDTPDFSIGDFWINTATDSIFQAVDVTTGAAIWVAVAGGSGLIASRRIAADSAFTGAGIGAATETAHTALTFTSANLNTARRTIRGFAFLRAPTANAADTWQIILRLGAAGVGGTLIVDSGAWDTVAGEVFRIEFEIQIRTVGAGGTFDATYTRWNETMGTWVPGKVTAGAIDTTVARDLTVTGTSSSANAAQAMTLTSFWAELYGA